MIILIKIVLKLNLINLRLISESLVDLVVKV